MEEFKTIIFDRVYNLLTGRLFAYDTIAHATEWDTIKISMDSVLKNLNAFSSKYVASSIQKHENQEEKLASVAAIQEVMAAKKEEIDV